MSKRNLGTQEAVELNILQILKLLLAKWWLVALCCLVMAGSAFGVSKYLMKPEYEASVLFHVNNLSFAEDNRFSNGDMDASKSLVQTYMVILNAHQTLDHLIEQAEVDLTAGQVSEMLSAKAVKRTEMLRITVTGTDPQDVGRLAQAIAVEFPKRVEQILVGSRATLAENPRVPTRPSGPNAKRNMVSAGLSGFVLGCSLVLLRAMFDVTLRREEQLTELLDYPLLARIPEHSGDENSRGIVGNRLKTQGQEGYKTLRTGLEYVLPQKKDARVVGMSSAMVVEGKTTSAANLAFSLSQLDRRVLLLECDLRRPSLHEKLPLFGGPGLSEYLCGQAALAEVVRLCTLRGGSFHVIRAGRVPPNPSELLNAKRMENLIKLLRQEYDDIILDLPPVGEVSDALTAAKYTDGMLLVVRRNYCNSLLLRAAVRQFEEMQAKILGIVLNCAEK